MINDQVFLSYSREDIWECRAIYNELRLAGFRVWIDNDLSPGSPNWLSEIIMALKVSACVVCICSPRAAGSKWVAIELEQANKLNIKIYPVFVGGETMEQALPSSISEIQATDCSKDYPTSIERLLSEIAVHHESARGIDLKTILASEGIIWTHFGSLFWFASEVRKLRLLIKPEEFNRERVLTSLEQLQHHAERLKVDKFTLRDIDLVINAFNQLNESLQDEDRLSIESKLRMIQDNVAKQAEQVDISFSNGPVPGGPIISPTN